MCVVPNAIEYRRLRTCQLAYYGRMGLGIKYRQIGRDELCTSGPNLELGGALVPPEKNKAKPREGCPQLWRSWADSAGDFFCRNALGSYEK